MKKKLSQFKDPQKDRVRFSDWVGQVETANGYLYEKRRLSTSLGLTQVYALNAEQTEAETLVIFPGFRTSALIWDLDRGVSSIFEGYRVFFVETNGQPNLSEGHSPSIKSLDYGIWGAEVLDQLGLEQTYIAGASFGGLVCMKIALAAPQKIKAAFLLNPGCFRFVALNFTTLFYNLLPILNPSPQNIQRFLDKIVFHKPQHQLSPQAEQLLLDYLHLAIARFKDRTEKPYYMGAQLDQVAVDTYLLVGTHDVLLPPEKSIARAKKHLKDHLKAVVPFEYVNHGNECHPPCLQYIKDTILARRQNKPLDAPSQG